MKKNLLKLLLISTMALAGCSGEHNDSTSSSAPIVEPDGKVEGITIKTTKSTFDVERGESVTVRATITGAENALANFTLVNDDAEVEAATIESSTTDGVTSVKIKGKKIGTATLTITSAANTNAWIKVKINVTKAISALSKVWAQVNNLSNYTIDVTRTATDEEMNNNNWDEDAQVPYAKIKVTDKFISHQTATVTDADLTKITYSDTLVNSDTSSSATYASVAGIGIDSNGYAYYVKRDASNNIVTTNNTIAKSSAGLLDSTNFGGAGDEATSPNDIGSFYSLRAINSSWLTSTKVTGNVYDIPAEGETATTYDSFVECTLWGLVDPIGYETYLSKASSLSFSDIAAQVETSITATSSNTVSFSVTYGDTTYSATMSDVGSTVAEDAIYSKVDTVTASFPTLNSDLALIQSTIAKNDYYEVDAYTVDSNGTKGYAYKFSYKNYYLVFNSPNLVNYYKTTYSRTLTSGGYYQNPTTGDVYSFTFTNGNATSEEIVAEGATITLGTQIITQYTYEQVSSAYTKEEWFAGVSGYLSMTDTFSSANASNLYTFTTGTTNSGEKVAYSTSKVVSDDLSENVYGDTFPNVLSGSNYTFDDSYVTEFYYTTDTTQDAEGNNVTTLESLDILFGSVTIPNKGSGYLLYGASLQFDCATNNPVHAAIEAKIAA